jgi:hypothetical protein
MVFTDGTRVIGTMCFPALIPDAENAPAIALFEPVLNRKTAQALGLSRPPALRFQADAVIR